MATENSAEATRQQSHRSSVHCGATGCLTARSLLVAILFIVLISLAVQQVTLVLGGPELLTTEYHKDEGVCVSLVDLSV